MFTSLARNGTARPVFLCKLTAISYVRYLAKLDSVTKFKQQTEKKLTEVSKLELIENRNWRRLRHFYLKLLRSFRSWGHNIFRAPQSGVEATW